MPIAPLPETTVRAIGSSQVLTDSASAVKELVDNALDARASSIVVEISTNVLDVIQVKDNGHGIAPEDRALVCQRYCTSKIRSFSDVSKIGGTWLGFRGEALASAAEMSGSVVVTTRIEGEPMATSLTFDRSGKLLSQDSISHPVGTTVRIVDFLKHIAVRKQVALKMVAKTSSKIKDVLKAYALARPSVRFSLKVLKAKNEKENWMYAPKAGATVTDAAIKVINQRAVAECAWHVWSFDLGSKLKMTAPSPSVDIAEVTKFEYTIESLLPQKQCDIAAISNVGQYVSIDSRPVSCTRGTLKEIVSIYKSCLKSSSSIESHDKLMNPFLCLNICCPPGSYDPNLEPAKDNVLFIDAEGVLRMVEKFFTHVYGEKEVVVTKGSKLRHLEDQEEGFGLLFHRKPRASEPDVTPFGRRKRDAMPSSRRSSVLLLGDDLFLEDSIHPPASTKKPALPDATPDSNGSADRIEHPTSSLEEPLPKRKAWKSTMYDKDEDGDVALEDAGELHSEVPEEYDEVAAKEIKYNNPWTLAKMNASIKPKIRASNFQEPGSIEGNGQPFTPARTGTERNNRGSPGQDGSRENLPILRESDALTHLPSPASTLYSAHEFSSPTRLPFSTNPLARHRNRMDSTGPVDLREEGNDLGVVGRHRQNNTNTSGAGFVSARSLPMGTPLVDIPDVSQRPSKQHQRKQGLQPRQGAGLLKPFVPPINRSQRAWSETPPTQQLPRDQYQQPHRTTDDLDNVPSAPIKGKLGSMAGRSSVQSVGSMHPDLAATMNFESRKEAAMQKKRAQLHQQTLDRVLGRNSEQQSSPSATSNSPHKNRYKKAIATLNSAEDPLDHHKSAFEKGDPRRFLARDLQAEESNDRDDESQLHKLKRWKTTHMPFESIPTGEAVHNLMITMDTSKRDPIDEETRLAECDEYIKSGEHPDGFDCTVEEARSWNTILQNLIESKLEEEQGHTQGVSFDLWAILQQHDMSREESVAIPDA
ncbi:hypothetical protein MMC30_000047 [Trapelia coarctata]|nr:hypothetical protein [Trapelia coarctata]